jgi:hypothetical protein
MRGFRNLRKWLCLPGRVGLLLGLGALSVTGSRAEPAAPAPTTPPSPTLGGLSIRSEGGRIYVAENGKDFREIELADTPETRRLAQMLEEREAGSPGSEIALYFMILAGAGGDGFHWTSPPRGNDAAKPAAGRSDERGRPATGSPRAPHRPRNATGERAYEKG